MHFSCRRLRFPRRCRSVVCSYSPSLCRRNHTRVFAPYSVFVAKSCTVSRILLVYVCFVPQDFACATRLVIFDPSKQELLVQEAEGREPSRLVTSVSSYRRPSRFSSCRLVVPALLLRPSFALSVTLAYPHCFPSSPIPLVNCVTLNYSASRPVPS